MRFGMTVKSVHVDSFIHKEYLETTGEEIAAFVSLKRLETLTDEWIHVSRNTKPTPATNGPVIPDDPECEAETIISKGGTSLLKPVVEDC